MNTAKFKWGQSEKVAIRKLEREVSPETNPADTLTVRK